MVTEFMKHPSTYFVSEIDFFCCLYSINHQYFCQFFHYKIFSKPGCEWIYKRYLILSKMLYYRSTWRQNKTNDLILILTCKFLSRSSDIIPRVYLQNERGLKLNARLSLKCIENIRYFQPGNFDTSRNK